MKKKRTKPISITSAMAHQRIDDHEKLCRIMQQENNKKFASLQRDINRLENIIMTSTGMLIVGMATIIHRIIFF